MQMRVRVELMCGGSALMFLNGLVKKLIVIDIVVFIFCSHLHILIWQTLSFNETKIKCSCYRTDSGRSVLVHKCEIVAGITETARN